MLCGMYRNYTWIIVGICNLRRRILLVISNKAITGHIIELAKKKDIFSHPLQVWVSLDIDLINCTILLDYSAMRCISIHAFLKIGMGCNGTFIAFCEYYCVKCSMKHEPQRNIYYVVCCFV